MLLSFSSIQKTPLPKAHRLSRLLLGSVVIPVPQRHRPRRSVISTSREPQPAKHAMPSTHRKEKSLIVVSERLKKSKRKLSINVVRGRYNRWKTETKKRGHEPGAHILTHEREDKKIRTRSCAKGNYARKNPNGSQLRQGSF